MRKIFILFFVISIPLYAFKIASRKEQKADVPVYNGHDLGVGYSLLQTSFKVWAPQATAVKLRLYKDGNGGDPTQVMDLQKGLGGTWQAVVKQDLKNQYYTFQTQLDGKWLLEGPDIYAKAVGVNGKRGMIVNMAATNPVGWAGDKKPYLKNFTDMMIYELHVRDLSMSANSGITHKGKFLGVTEKGTKSPDGEVTGLDHIKQLGVTHIHLLPSFDFSTVDETGRGPQFNWGYDPQNYNTPEGSYATNAYDGKVRIKEFKQMVQTLHANGLRVILDVVYNHTTNAATSTFNQFAPGYFYRHKADGSLSDATGCGNETASEEPMMQKYMIESVLYWAKEYHLDGFRFDLMGVHDIVTMNAISDALHKFDPTIFIYGEGWTAGDSPMPERLRAVKKNIPQLNKIAAFSDEIRDGLRGPYSDVKAKGFVSGKSGTAESVKFGIVASTQHPQINYKLVNYSKEPWAMEPYQAINYASCHDDNTLFDRLKIANPDASEAELIRMNNLADAVVLTSQGVPFLHAGSELLRSKQGIANSYNLPDSINQIDWSRKTKYKAVFNYYQGLIALRKLHPAFRMPSTTMIQQHLEFLDMNDPMIIGYRLKDNANGDAWKNILVLFNGDAADKTVKLPAGKWILAVDGETVNLKAIKQVGGTVTLPGTSAWVMHQE
jgi:pullulanase